MIYTVNARLWRQSATMYRIICGRKECSEELGYAMRGDTIEGASEPDDETAWIMDSGEELGYSVRDAVDAMGEQARKTWYLEHGTKQYRVDEHGDYHVVQPRRYQPRRPLPEEVASTYHVMSDGDPVRIIIGEKPQLPLYLHCPACKHRGGETRNLVQLPHLTLQLR